MQSVLQDWVMELSLREQGTLLTAVRGCDLVPKYPLDSAERIITSCIRGAFMVPADEREVDAEIGCFMSAKIPQFKWSALGHYPQHWISHILHAIEVLGWQHPDTKVRAKWHCIYLDGCKSLHVSPETYGMYKCRMLEDRIKSNCIVQ